MTEARRIDQRPGFWPARVRGADGLWRQCVKSQDPEPVEAKKGPRRGARGRFAKAGG